MSEDPNSKDDKNKDLTGIFELPQSEPLSLEDDPFAVNFPPPTETIDSFDSIEQLGMIDHPPVSEESFSTMEPTPQNFEAEGPLETPFEATTAANTDFSLEAPSLETHASASELLEPEPPLDFMESMKSYSEKAKETAFDPGTRYPFHLLIQGDFDPYARDKLLLFINENPVGTSSSELDLQINGGRVLMPRISEFAGIKLIQDLRDSGLRFILKPSDQDPDEVIPNAPSLSVHYSDQTSAKKIQSSPPIPVLPREMLDTKVYEVIDSLQMVQFLKAEILEVEKSELFQELLDRMTVAIKNKAKILGANAITSVQHKITPLRLPSQYQIELSATLLKKL